jgi:hypothetical protein
MHIGVDSYELSIEICGRSIEINGPCYKYTITHALHGNKLPRRLLLRHRRACVHIFTETQESLIKIRNLIFRCSLPMVDI